MPARPFGSGPIRRYNNSMDLRHKLDKDLKQAMRAKNTLTMETLRSIRAAVLNREVAVGKTLDDAEILKVIQGLVKQRGDSIEQYEAGGRTDLVEQERQEQEILKAYLPAVPDEAAMQQAVDEAISALGESSLKDMGKVMKACQERLGPSVDGKALSGLVRKALS